MGQHHAIASLGGPTAIVDKDEDLQKNEGDKKAEAKMAELAKTTDPAEDPAAWWLQAKAWWGGEPDVDVGVGRGPRAIMTLRPSYES